MYPIVVYYILEELLSLINCSSTGKKTVDIPHYVPLNEHAAELEKTKIDNWAVTCDFQQCGILTSLDSGCATSF